MAILDTISVTASNQYKEWVLKKVFRYTGSTTESTTEMQLKVITTGPGTRPAISEYVKFRRDVDSVFIHGYNIAIPAESRVTGFEFREIEDNVVTSDLTASVTLTSAEQKQFDQQGILYIDEIRFSLNVSYVKED